MPDLTSTSDFSYSRSAVDLVADRLGSRKQAIEALIKDLQMGFIRAVGFESTASSSRVSRRGGKPASLQYVPQRFWQIGTAKDMAAWDWSRGYFSLKEPYIELQGAGSAWTDVRFEAAHLPEVGKPRSSRGRKRTPLWEDWVAALAILSTHGEINGELTETKLLEKIAEKMGSWNVDPMARATTRKAATTILTRLRDEGI